MKKLNVLLLAITFAMVSVVSVSAARANPTEPGKILSKEVKTLLKNPYFKIEDELTAYVTLIVNDNDEIVVLSVYSESEILEGFIKSRLNYQKVNVKFDSDIRIFRLPVRLVER